MTTIEAIDILRTRRDNAQKSNWTDPTLVKEVESYALALDMAICSLRLFQEHGEEFRAIVNKSIPLEKRF